MADGFEGMDVAGLLLEVTRKQAQGMGLSPGDWVSACVKEAVDMTLANLPIEKRDGAVRMMHAAVEGYFNALIKETERREAEQSEAVCEALDTIAKAVSRGC